jgi:hypothetical protein
VYVEENPLRRARLACGIRLSELSMRTALSPSILQKIDAGRFAELPGGVYARSYIRAVASVVGLDPDETVQQLASRLPPAEDPLPVLREIARFNDPAWLLELARIGTLLKRRLANGRDGVSPIAKRAVAAGVDAVLLLLQLAVVAQVTAWTCGVPTTTLLATHGGALLPLFVVQIVLYFVVLGGIGGRTPGAFVSRLPVGTGAAPLAPHAVLQRSLR